MKPLNVKAFVFDLGGTLYGPSPDLVITTKDFLSQVGLSTYSDDQIVRGRSAAEAWLEKLMYDMNAQPHWEPSHDDWLEYDRQMLSALGVDEGVDEYARVYQQKWDSKLARMEEQLLEGCRGALEELRSRGYRLGVVSNRWGSPNPYLDRDRITSLFESVEYSNVPGYMKPSPYMLVQVASQLHVNPMKIAYVGDKVEFDVAAAQRAGAVPVLLAWGRSEDEKNAPAGITILKHATELLELSQPTKAQKSRGQR
jgi:phosphoglycolate phosphatase